MGHDASSSWLFTTDRLVVGPWHEVADLLGVDLGRVVAGLLPARTTAFLPTDVHGGQSVESAREWIHERDSDASTMLVVEVVSRAPVGLLLLAGAAMSDHGRDLRIGYLLAESARGRGLATELVSGLRRWAGTQPGIRTLSGGVDPANRASARVLEKCGFELVDDSGDTAQYELEVSRATSGTAVRPGSDTGSAEPP